jgi:hypothetical protein
MKIGTQVAEGSLYLVIFSNTLLTNSMEQSSSWEAKHILSYSRNSPHFMEPEGS